MRQIAYSSLKLLDSHLMSLFIVLASICATIILFEILTSASGIKKKTMILFTIGTFILVAGNIATLVWEGQPGKLAHTMMYVANFTTASMNLFLLYTFNLYLQQFLKESESMKTTHRRFKINNIIIVLGVILLVVAQFTGLYYTIDETNTFQVSKYIGILFLCPLSVLILLISLTIQYYSRLPKKIRFLLLLFTCNPIVSSITELYLANFEEFMELESSHQISTLSTVAMAILLYLFDLANVRSIEKHNSDLKEQMEQKSKQIIKTQDNLIISMAMIVESRDKSTGAHILRTKELVKLITDEISASSDIVFSSKNYKNNLVQAAPLHDLGKIGVDDVILRKPGKFTPEEFEVMKTHARKGADVLDNVLYNIDENDFKRVAVDIAHYHHERWDGSGYPEGLKGEEIPIEARIMAIADVYDALVSKRVYKEKMTFEEANKIILDGMGKQFDPSLEKYYVAALPKFEEYYRNLDEN